MSRRHPAIKAAQRSTTPKPVAGGRNGGHEIVRALDTLRRAGRRGREEDGRWRMEQA